MSYSAKRDGELADLLGRYTGAEVKLKQELRLRKMVTARHMRSQPKGRIIVSSVGVEERRQAESKLTEASHAFYAVQYALFAHIETLVNGPKS